MRECRPPNNNAVVAIAARAPTRGQYVRLRIVSPHIPLTIGRGATLRNHGAGLPRPNAGYEFDQPINHQADPDDDQQAPIEPERLMLRRKRQVRHEDEEVEQASEDDGGGLLEEAGEHVQWLVASGQWPVAS